MKKIYKILVPIIGLVLAFGVFADLAKAAPPDQRCDASGNGFVSIIMPPEGMFSQTFTPGKNRLTRVKSLVFGDGFGTVGMLLYNGGTYVATNSNGMQAEPNGQGILTFEFNDVEMTSGWAGYKLKPFYSAGNKVLAWYFDTDCYAYGNAFQGEEVRDFQLDFATYGYDHEEPADDPLADPEESGNSIDPDSSADSESSATSDTTGSTSTGTTSTPTLKTTSSSIRTPKTVTAEDVPDDQGGATKITWDKSTTSKIDGYQVYKKDSVEGEFEAIIAVSSDGLTFVDEDAPVGIKYYYSVRAYKGDLESKDSDIVETESADNLAPTIPSNFKIINQTSSTIKLSWDNNGEEDLDGYLLAVTQRDDSSDFAKEIEINKDVNEYVLNKSELGEIDFNEVDVYLQAKDINSNFSDQTDVVRGEFSGIANYYYWGGGAFLVIIVATVFAIYYKKRLVKKYRV